MSIFNKKLKEKITMFYLPFIFIFKNIFQES